MTRSDATTFKLFVFYFTLGVFLVSSGWTLEESVDERIDTTLTLSRKLEVKRSLSSRRCPKCPPGSGKTIHRNGTCTCEPCIEGTTYSNSETQGKCTPCTESCSGNVVIIKPCTVKTNTECGSTKCVAGYRILFGACISIDPPSTTTMASSSMSSSNHMTSVAALPSTIPTDPPSTSTMASSLSSSSRLTSVAALPSTAAGISTTSTARPTIAPSSATSTVAIATTPAVTSKTPNAHFPIPPKRDNSSSSHLHLQRPSNSPANNSNVVQHQYVRLIISCSVGLSSIIIICIIACVLYKKARRRRRRRRSQSTPDSSITLVKKLPKDVLVHLAVELLNPKNEAYYKNFEGRFNVITKKDIAEVSANMLHAPQHAGSATTIFVKEFFDNLLHEVTVEEFRQELYKMDAAGTASILDDFDSLGSDKYEILDPNQNDEYISEHLFLPEDASDGQFAVPDSPPASRDTWSTYSTEDTTLDSQSSMSLLLLDDIV